MSTIAPEELMRWRREVWGDGEVSLAEADALVAMNREADPDDRQWSEFVGEALTDFLIRRGEPRGYVTDADADWLIERLGKDGRINSLIELRLIDHLFERATAVPVKLKAFALEAMECAIRDGPTREGRDPGAISAIDAALLRRFVFAPAGDEPAHVSRAEAEMLWRLKDGAAGQPNAPEWKTLFVQAVGNHLLTAAPAELTSHQPKREGLDRFVALLAATRPAQSGAGFDAEERAWTEARTLADGAVDEYEEALLEFVCR